MELLKRPEITYDDAAVIDDVRPKLSAHQKTMMEVQIKYEGYIIKQQQQIEKFKKLEHKNCRLIWIIFRSRFADRSTSKLDALRPISVGQASRISGVSPADINVLLIWLEKMRRQKH